jgi:hypothetical protein
VNERIVQLALSASWNSSASPSASVGQEGRGVVAAGMEQGLVSGEDGGVFQGR